LSEGGSNPSHRVKKEWIASSQALLAMTKEGFIPCPIKQLPLFRSIAGPSPAMTKRNHEREVRMRFRPPKLGIALLLLAPLLAGCLERGQPTMVNAGGDDDDAFCRASNAVGSPEYVACRKDRDVQRNNANARADRRQRDLGEYMLNHPDHP
jgi:hypothetical protein